MPDPKRVFISHSKYDNKWVREFVGALQSKGWDIWYDKTGLKPGAVWINTIERELQNRDIFLLILTPKAWKSHWVQEELKLAQVRQKRIILIIHKRARVSGFSLTRQHIDVVGMSGAEAAQHLVEAIEQPSDPPPPPRPWYRLNHPWIFAVALLALIMAAFSRVLVEWQALSLRIDPQLDLANFLLHASAGIALAAWLAALGYSVYLRKWWWLGAALLLGIPLLLTLLTDSTIPYLFTSAAGLVFGYGGTKHRESSGSREVREITAGLPESAQPASNERKPTEL